MFFSLMAKKSDEKFRHFASSKTSAVMLANFTRDVGKLHTCRSQSYNVSFSTIKQEGSQTGCLHCCGETGIRTQGTRKSTPHFECGPFDHSGIPPFAAAKLQFYFEPAKSKGRKVMLLPLQ